MKKKALMKLLAVSIAATMMFTGCEKADPATSGTGTTTESTLESNTSTETAKTSETTETAKTTESAAGSTEKAAVAVEELDKTMYSSKLVNVRAEPNERAERVSSLKKGAEVHVTGLCDNGWYRVDLGDGKVAYCPDGYLVDSLE